MYLQKIIKHLKQPKNWPKFIFNLKIFTLLPENTYLKIKFWLYLGEKLDLKNPKTFNEKLQWLKLNNRNPLHTTFVDKYLVRDYIKKTLGEEYLIPLLGVWDDPSEIDFDKLPDKFVLKCNHNSGLGMCICKDKSKLDIAKVRSELKKGLEQDYFSTTKEWPYKNVPRKIICEKYMTDSGSNSDSLTDYKIFCFNGVPEIILVCTDRFKSTGLTEAHYDTSWNRLNLARPNFNDSKDECERPILLDKMLEFTKILAKDTSYSRIDFYIIENKLYFGEITFFPSSGFRKFVPENWDEILGEWIKLPTDNKA